MSRHAARCGAIALPGVRTRRIFASHADFSLVGVWRLSLHGAADRALGTFVFFSFRRCFALVAFFYIAYCLGGQDGHAGHARDWTYMRSYESGAQFFHQRTPAHASSLSELVYARSCSWFRLVDAKSVAFTTCSRGSSVFRRYKFSLNNLARGHSRERDPF